MRDASRTALVAGAAGRLGEAVLNRVLASGGYPAVYALARSPMAMGVSGLALAFQHALPPLDDVFVVLGAASDGTSRSFYGRDAPFEQVGQTQLLSLMRAACTAGAKRLVLVAPTPVWQQIGGLHAGLSGEELGLAALPLTSLTVLRPVSESGSQARNWVERVAAVYTSLQMFAMPRSMSVMTSERLARCTLAAMRTAADGVRILGADKIPLLLAPAAERA